MPKIVFRDKKVTADVETGLSILDASMRFRVPLYHTCGGNASCSTCRVMVIKGGENLSPIETAEAQILDSFDLQSPHRLGCQARIMKDQVEVEIPDRKKEPRPNKTPRLPDSGAS